jgi:hypothetical protein
VGREKIILLQKDNVRKKIITNEKKCKEKWQENCHICYKNKDNNPSISNINVDLKLPSDDGKTPNNCQTMEF